MNRLFKLFLFPSLFGLFLSPVFGQFEFRNDSFKLKKTQNAINSPDYVKHENDWGKSSYSSDFDPVLAERFQYALDSLMAKYYLIGASACIIMPEKGTWKGVYGVSDPAIGDSIKPETLFWIDSNTKTFVSTIILQLEEDGVLSLDDELHKWLPNYNNVDSTITIRQLLNHTAGLNDFLNENPRCMKSIIADTSRYWSPQYTLNYVLSPNFPPGTSWSYSNTGYILAGLIIRQATGEATFAAPLRQRLLNPLNLTHTYMGIEESLAGKLAHGWYVYTNGEYIDQSVWSSTAARSSAWTAGAIVSTAEDMARWIGALYSGKILSDNALNSMRTLVPINILDRNFIGYGMGTIKWICLGETLWCHGGSTSGSRSQFAYFQKKDISMTLLINCGNNYDRPTFILEEMFKTILNYYQYPHDKIHADKVMLNTYYVTPNQDSVKISAHIHNPANHSIMAFSKIENTDATYQDSIALYDDGLHGDSLAGDMIFGGVFLPINREDDFSVSVSTLDVDSNYQYIQEKINYFTTIGPVSFDSYDIISNDTIPNPGDIIRLNLRLKNDGLEAIAKNISAEISSLDSCVLVNAVKSKSTFADLNPGNIVTCDSYYTIKIQKTCSEEREIQFNISISSDGYSFWSDTFSIGINLETEVAEGNTKAIPSKYMLHQNYPNPFNPKTVISYQLPVASDITLSIYSITGQKVATLVSEIQTPGNHKYEWDASNMASGVYYYRLTADNFVGMKKLILLK